MSRPRLAVGLLVFSWSLFLSSAHGEDWPVPRGPSNEPVVYRYDPAVLKTIPKEFIEDAPACVIYSGMNYLIEGDGTIETVIHDITRFNGRKGIDKLGEYRNIFYTPAYQKLTLNEARVHKPDGRTVPIEPRHVQLRDLATDFQVYDRDKQLIISFPNLEVGDVIEVKWTTRGKNPEYQGRFFNRYTFGSDTYPVVLDELRVKLATKQTLKYAAVGGKLEPTIKRGTNFRLYHWEVRNRPQLPQYDDLPPKEDLRLQVALSTFNTWEEVHQWKQKLRADCWECTPEIRKIVEEVTRDLKTPLEKARALTYWVRRNIRYVSAGEGHDFTPHRPATILANRYGDCKDTSQLLAVMLKEAGVPVSLVTIGARGDGQILPNVPSPWGTHAILLVTLDGKEHWIDTTISLAGWDFLPHGDRDRVCYLIEDKALRLSRTPPLTPEINRYDQTTVIRVQADGTSLCERSTVFHGLAALTRRDDWLEAPVGDRRRLMASELQDANSRTRLRELIIDEKQLRDFDQPVSGRALFEIPGHFTGESDRDGSITDSKVWGKILSFNLDHDRSVALELWAPFESRHRYVIHLPPAFRLDTLPRNRAISSKWGFFNLTVEGKSDQPRQVVLEFHTRMDKVRIEPADFDEFRKFHEEVAKYYRVWLTLKPAQSLADAAMLEAILFLKPSDSASAWVLARLYHQNGLRKEAQRVLKRALEREPGDLALLELSVKAAATLEEEEAAHRELARRFPEEPKHAVALGEVLVDRGEYESAQKVLQPIADKGPPLRRAQANYHLARACFSQDKPKQALVHLLTASLADPETAHQVRFYLLQGQVEEKLGQTSKAIEAYEKALRVDADTEEALASLVRLHLAANDRDEALRHLRRYTIVVGDKMMGLIRAAEWHLQLGRYEDAFDLASRAREIRFHEKTQQILGLVYLQRGDHTKAVFHLEKADPTSQGCEGLIRGYLALGKLREAEEQVDKARRLDPISPELRRTMEVVDALVQRRKALLKQMETNPPREGLARSIDAYLCADHALANGLSADRVEPLLRSAFDNGLELGPAFALRGLLALERGKLTRALADAERAVALSPQEGRAFYVRGRIRLERGDNKEAIADLTKAVELTQRKDARGLHWLAAALFRNGRSQEALATQRQAVQLLPKDDEILEQLNEIKKAGKP